MSSSPAWSNHIRPPGQGTQHLPGANEAVTWRVAIEAWLPFLSAGRPEGDPATPGTVIPLSRQRHDPHPDPCRHRLGHRVACRRGDPDRPQEFPFDRGHPVVAARVVVDPPAPTAPRVETDPAGSLRGRTSSAAPPWLGPGRRRDRHAPRPCGLGVGVDLHLDENHRSSVLTLPDPDRAASGRLPGIGDPLFLRQSWPPAVGAVSTPGRPLPRRDCKLSVTNPLPTCTSHGRVQHRPVTRGLTRRLGYAALDSVLLLWRPFSPTFANPRVRPLLSAARVYPSLPGRAPDRPPGTPRRLRRWNRDCRRSPCFFSGSGPADVRTGATLWPSGRRPWTNPIAYAPAVCVPARPWSWLRTENHTTFPIPAQAPPARRRPARDREMTAAVRGAHDLPTALGVRGSSLVSPDHRRPDDVSLTLSSC